MLRPLTFAMLLLAACSTSSSLTPLQKVDRWAILLSYNPDKHPVSPKQVDCLEMAIFDPDDHPPLSWLKKEALPIAYISVGEAELYRDYWPDIQNEPWVLDQNPDWPKSRYVDIRAPQWQELLIQKVIPKARAQGFVGIMMDTLDTVSILAERNPKEADSYRDGMVALVQAIHENFPDLIIISNNGFDILSEIAPYLNAILVEDIFWMPDFKKGSGYRRVPEAWQKAKIAAIQPIMQAYHLPVFAVDYVEPTNHKAIRETIRKLKELGYHPYIAQKNLDQITSYRGQGCD